jgi:transcriptional regulator with XRE-family HTH domain
VPGKNLSPQQNQRIRDAIKAMLANGSNQTTLAKQLGIRQSTISAFLDAKQGTGLHVAMRVAQLVGVDLVTLLDVASGEAEQRKRLSSFPPPDISPERIERWVDWICDHAPFDATDDEIEELRDVLSEQKLQIQALRARIRELEATK